MHKNLVLIDKKIDESILKIAEDNNDDDNKENNKDDKNSGFFNKNKNMKPKRGKFNIKGILMLAFVITLFINLPTFFNEKSESPSNVVGYSEFIKMIQNKELSRVEEKEGYVYGYSVDETRKESYKTRMITDRLGGDLNLVSAISNNEVKIKSLPPEELPFLVNILVSWFPMLLLIGVWVFMLTRMNKGGGGGPQIFNVGKSKVKENGENTVKVTFADVAGIDEAKVELEEIVHFLKEPDKYKKIGAKIPKGVLLLGNPGTGKTLLAKAVAGEAGVPFLSMSGSEFVEMFVGVGASRVRDLFGKARKASPCIVFIDEIDAVGRKRGSGQGGGNDEREQTLNQLLVEMDGFGNDETIIVLAATNRPEVLDRALMRPGRFDRQVVVEPPDIKGREEILKVHMRDKKLDPSVNLGVLARKTPGFVGADLANLLNEAAILAARDGRDTINMHDLEEASEKVSIGPERKSKVTILKERQIIAYHEIGHTLVQMMLPNTDPVHKVTIIPRGSAALGYTMSLPTEDKYLKSKKEYLSEIRILLGGRAAEQIIFDDITTGASNDIQRATAIAHAIVTKFGMSEKFGPILLDSTSEGDMFAQKHYSETTGKEIDDEIRLIVNEAYKDVIDLLTKEHDKLEYFSQTLLERETINHDELLLMIKGEKLPDLIVNENKTIKENKEEKVEESVIEIEKNEEKETDKKEEDPNYEIIKDLKKISKNFQEEIEIHELDEELENEGEEIAEEIEEEKLNKKILDESKKDK